MAKEIKFSEDARRAMLRGVDALSKRSKSNTRSKRP